MKRFLLLMITILLVSCSNSNDDDNDDGLRTFLETHDGTVWYNDDHADPEYHRIVNDENIIVELWDYSFPACSQYYHSGQETNFVITKNSEEKLVIEFTYDDGTVTETYSIRNDNLILVETSLPSGYTKTRVLLPSNVDVDSWPKCN